MPAIGFIFALFFVQPLFAANYDFSLKEGDRLVIVGFGAQVHINGDSSNTLHVTGLEDSVSEGAFTVARKNNIIEVKMNEYTGKRAWLNVSQHNPQQLRKIEISGGSIPTEISLRYGSVAVQKWSKDLKVNLTQGRFSSTGGSGLLRVYLQKGDTNIQEHVGKINLDSYGGNVALRNIQGDIEADVFSGQVQIEKNRGFLSLVTQLAHSKINQGSGTVQFENGKGSLNVQAFQGRVEGKSQEGSVTIAMAPDSETDVKSKSGKVNIQLPLNSGAHLNLLTTEGEIFVPAELKVSKIGTEKFVRGRLRGDAQGGSVFVRSQDGVISVK
ncbi:MAG: DUF4097 family beta strand repeat-containing protein [Pseudobdellovibrionaceae bacterium]